MRDEQSKTFVLPNGDLKDVVKVREALFQYWGLTLAEKEAFDRLKDRNDLKERYLFKRL
jgi:hypothetical protein